LALLTPPRYAVLQLKRATVRAHPDYTIRLLDLQAPIWAILAAIDVLLQFNRDFAD
jgi:hypothetical protein